ncbi:hypothetical protein LAZ67_1006863 [Cordylochernes scorpioides]|uniref:Retrotransposon gag domain-containing protein n=1 Tax=Cordylochernes scorpioides TaxID=51811 RepID=A0ABY6JYV1_9ARAC|nr:hypothetical protein LAZ67_1006863 [Cordylochernes scorpioides]
MNDSQVALILTCNTSKEILTSLQKGYEDEEPIFDNEDKYPTYEPDEEAFKVSHGDLLPSTYEEAISYATMMDYEFHHFDVETAYLYGKLTETIYMTQPEGYQRQVYFYLSGTALKWFENNEESIQTWKEFTSQLENVFGKNENSKLQAEKKLKTRAQLKGESTKCYIQDLLCLCKEVDPQMSEEDKISHLMKGIAEELYQALLPRDVQSTEQFITECRRVEALRCRRVTPTKYERLPNVASLCDQDDGEDLSTLIRKIVREEIKQVLDFPHEEPKIAVIEDLVREEIVKTLAPRSKPTISPLKQPDRNQILDTRPKRYDRILNLITESEGDVTPMNGGQLRESQSVSTADAQVTSSAIAATGRDTMRYSILFWDIWSSEFMNNS